MEATRPLRQATSILLVLVLLLAVPDLSVHARSVEGVSKKSGNSPDVPGLRTRAGGRHDDAANPGVQHAEQMKYAVGKPEVPVQVIAGSQQDVARAQDPPQQWEGISQAAQDLGRAVQLHAAAKNINEAVQAIVDKHNHLAGGDVKGAGGDVDVDVDVDTNDGKEVVYVDDVEDDDDENDDDDEEDDDEPEDEDDDEDSEWDEDESDEDEAGYLKNPRDQIELDQGETGQDVAQHAQQSQHLMLHRAEESPIVTPDGYTEDEILKIVGTPGPALITSEEDWEEGEEGEEGEDGQPPGGLVLDADRLMGDDPAAAEKVLRGGGARPWKEFKAVRMPIRFESYDVEPADGLITLQELVNVTGARINVHRAFNASDTNGDGFLDRAEFYAAPWKLGPNWRHVAEQEVEHSKVTSANDDDDDYDDDYDEGYDVDDDYDDDEWDEWETWDEDPEFWDDVDDADIF